MLGEWNLDTGKKKLSVNLVSKTKFAMAVSEVFSGTDPDKHRHSLFQLVL